MSDDNSIPSRVSISYSVDLIEVPDRVKILLDELAASFGGISKLTRDAGAMVIEEPVLGTQKMSELHKLINKCALRVDDSIEIMMGYIQMLQRFAEQQQLAAPPPEEEPKPTKKKAKKKTKKKATKKKATKKKDD